MRPRIALARAWVGGDHRCLSLASLCAYISLATIQGALVALPRPLADARLARLRSPAWALAGPGSLLVGTFGVLAVPSLASGLAILAAVATPVLAFIAVVAVIHGGRRELLLVPVALAAVALGASGLAAQLAATLLTALGCLTLGAAIARLTPTRWLQVGVLAMAVIDVLLIVLGIGQQATALLGNALSGAEPAFHRAELGPIRKDYPDLVLAAVLGGVVAGRASQRRTAVLVGLLATANGGLFAFADILPATVPLVLALILVDRTPGRHRRADGSQNAISAPSGTATTLRRPRGPSRGSSRTVAPSPCARAVASATE
jgi:hypothetical protein